MITISHLSHQYTSPVGKTTKVLSEISLEIFEHEYLAILGPNGSGKTTLARCLNGLLKPTSGLIIVDDLDVTQPNTLWEVRRRVGMVLQNPDNQIVSATVEREIAFGLENLGLPSRVIQKRVEAALTRFNLGSYRHQGPHRLSGGEKQRLAIASVMAMEPKYLVLDEPTSLLDPKSRQELRNLLQEIHSEGKTTVFHITQFPEEALDANRLLILAKGRILKDGDPLSIFNQPVVLGQWGLEAPLPFQLNTALQESGCTLPQNILLEKNDSLYDEMENLTEIQNRSEETTESEYRLITDHLSYVYDKDLPSERKALHEVSLGIRKGECVVLIGPTGSGKTTLAEHFMGLVKTSQGKVFIDGVDLWQDKRELNTVRRKIGLLFQFPELHFFEETVKDEISFGPRNIGFEDEKIQKCVDEALGKVGLDSQIFGSRSPFTLSTGEQRLVAIASILSMKPEILILDEPTAGLDPAGVRRIFDLIQQLHEDGVTILLISHHIDLIAQVAQRIVVLNEGRIVLEGSPEHVFQHRSLLKSIGLDIPRLTKIMIELRQQGWDVRTDVFTLEEAQAEILAHQPASHS